MDNTASGARQLFLNVLGNLGAGLVIALATALWERLRHQSVDWYGIAALFLLTSITFYLLFYLLAKKTPLRKKTDSGPAVNNDWREIWSKPRLELISGQNYVNKTIDVDGKSFRDCIFENVTFMFHGTAPADFVGTNRIMGGFSIDTDHPVAMLYSKLQRFARSIPGARTIEGEVNEKGNLLPDHFKISPVLPDVAASPLKAEALATIPVHSDDSGSEIDGEVYRLVMSPRVMSWELFRDIHRAAGKSDKALLDTDILVEMYLVNKHADKARYIRELQLFAQVDGVQVEFKRQDDLSSHDENFDYGLSGEGAQFAKETTPLKRLCERLPLALAPEQPIEGWVRFMASEINPEKIAKGTIRLVVIDSVGNKYPIQKVPVGRERCGEIGLLRVRPRGE